MKVIDIIFHQNKIEKKNSFRIYMNNKIKRRENDRDWTLDRGRETLKIHHSLGKMYG